MLWDGCWLDLSSGVFMTDKFLFVIYGKFKEEGHWFCLFCSFQKNERVFFPLMHDSLPFISWKCPYVVPLVGLALECMKKGKKKNEEIYSC